MATMPSMLWLLLLMWTTSFAASRNSTVMTWHNITNSMALCNDFTPAGFFFRPSCTGNNKWVIYLESGGFCASAETCNRRYTNSSLRPGDLLTDVDLTPIWVRSCRQFPPSNGPFDVGLDSTCNGAISPVMTSLLRYAPDKSNFNITGKDFFSSSSKDNQMFSEYNHVLIPYCSSDLWLGDDQRNQSHSEPFRFNPNETKSIQFTFRGSVIFRGAIADLLASHNLSNASEIVFIGSSAGGVGVMNQMKWLESTIRANRSENVSMSAILDSSWFIDFRDSLRGILYKEASVTTSQHATDSPILKSFDHLESCRNSTANGVPCCLLADCMLTNPQFYPQHIPTMTIHSLYDVYILAVSLRTDSFLAQITGSGESHCPLQVCHPWDPAASSNLLGGGLSFNYLQLVSEYGGTMNSSVNSVVQRNSRVSYMITSCFQHIYFAPSSLIGTESASYLTTSSKLFSTGVLLDILNHTQQSGYWSSLQIPVFPSHQWGNKTSITIQESIQAWRNTFVNMSQSSVERVLARQSCHEPHCMQNVCPETFNSSISNNYQWIFELQILVILCVLLIVLCSIMLWLFLKLHYCCLHHRQRNYLDNHAHYRNLGNMTDAGPYSFPSVMVGGYSIACRNLSYSVTYQRKKHKEVEEDRLLVLAEVDPEMSYRSTRLSEQFGDDYVPGKVDDNGHFENLDNKEWEAGFREPEDPEKEDLSVPKANPDWNQSGNNSYDALGAEESQDFTDTMSTIQTGGRTLESQRSTLHSSSSIKRAPSGGAGNRPNLRRTTTQVSMRIVGDYVGERVDRFRNIEPVSRVESSLQSRTQTILKDVSVYFNPGELVAIMGPSGCGKTTLLDILTGRRNTGRIQGEVLINGFQLDYIREEYRSNTGYLMQLTSPFYEELTVRENLTLAAQLRLPGSMTTTDRFDRVEKVLYEVQLQDKADVRVGGSYGPGLSGGQKRRLAIAIQLLNQPQVLVLDEPTSGLDSTASFDLLTMLNQLTKSNRTIILTIHQPRLEIFHMFHKIVFLCEGQVAYFGQPANAYEVCTTALKKKLASKNQVIPGLEDHNPADIIVDMLGNLKFRNILIEHYKASREPKWVKRAIQEALYDANISLYAKEATDGGTLRTKKKQPSILNRLSAYEARAAKRAAFAQLLYLPIFFACYGILLGTVYLQTMSAFLVMSGFCVYSVASALFMFPAMHLYYDRALQLYKIEHLDGVGRCFDLVIQGFIRFVTLAFIPVVVCAAILYFLVVRVENYDAYVLGRLIVVNLALNQTWIALLALLITGFPSLCIRLSPVLAAVFGFASGFFVPITQMPPWYCWLFYINPNFYGFSSSAYILLDNFHPKCDQSELECYVKSGEYILRQFSFDQINPYLNLVILMGMTFVFLVLATLAMLFRHTDVKTKLKQLKALSSAKMKQMKGAPSSLVRTFSHLSTHPLTQSTNEVAGSRHREERPSLLENSLEIIDPLHVSHGVRRRHSSLDDIDGITEEDELTADDFDSDDGMLDDDGTLNETVFHDPYSAHEDDEGSPPSMLHETLDGKTPNVFNPMYQRSAASDYQLQELSQNGKGAGPRGDLSDDDYDGPEMHTRRPVHEVGVDEPGLPPSIQILGMSSPEMSTLPEELEDSFITRTEPRLSDRAFLDEELKAQDTILQEMAAGIKPDTRSRHTSATSARSQLSLSAAPPEIMRQQSNQSRGGRRTGGLGKTEHELTRFEGRGRPTRKGQIRRGRYRSVYLNEGEQHRVWLPRLQTDMEISPPSTVQSPPNFNHSFSMTDIYGKEVGRELTSPDPVKNLVTNRKRLESRVKAAQEVGRQVTDEIARGNEKGLHNFTRMVTKRLKRRKKHEPFPFQDMILAAMSAQEEEEGVDGGHLREPHYSSGEVHVPRHPSVKTHAHRLPSASHYPHGMRSKGLSKSPSVPAGTAPGLQQVPMDQQEELSFDTLRKRGSQEKDKWRKGMKKLLVQQSSARPLPINIYRQLLKDSSHMLPSLSDQDILSPTRAKRPLSMEESSEFQPPKFNKKSDYRKSLPPGSTLDRSQLSQYHSGLSNGNGALSVTAEIASQVPSKPAFPQKRVDRTHASMGFQVDAFGTDDTEGLPDHDFHDDVFTPTVGASKTSGGIEQPNGDATQHTDSS